MIIQIRGTSGSGKSTVMRKVMDHIGDWEPKYIPGRKRPLWYKSGPIAVLGHYEIDCGGCDTIGSAPKVYEVLQSVLSSGISTVLSEGLLWGEDVKWSLKLQDVRAVFLTTSIDECLRRVELRQAGREPADRERVIRKLTRRVTTIESARRRLVQAGVCCRRCTSEQAPGIVLKWVRESQATR